MLFRLHGSKGEGENVLVWAQGLPLWSVAAQAMTSPAPAGTPCRHASTGLAEFHNL